MTEEIKEKLEEELEQIESKIRLKETEIRNSSEYKLLIKKGDDLWEKRRENERELKNLKKPIYEKYVHNFRRLGFNTKNIKSSVKQGIKKGLGITNVSFIDEYDLRKIVQQLIGKDLEKIRTQEDKLIIKTNEFDKQIDKNDNEKQKLINNGLNALTKQRKKIDDKLNEQENLKYKRTKEKKKEVEIKIKNHLPKLMDNIVKEVNKELIVEGLE